nr:MAG TPA: hypothetical protein [Caudoviricetes sp.]
MWSSSIFYILSINFVIVKAFYPLLLYVTI